jgi:hypothetical protein
MVTDSALLQAKLAADARARVFAGFDPVWQTDRPASLTLVGMRAAAPGGQVGYALAGGLRPARTSAWSRQTGPSRRRGRAGHPPSPGSDA